MPECHNLTDNPKSGENDGFGEMGESGHEEEMLRAGSEAPSNLFNDDTPAVASASHDKDNGASITLNDDRERRSSMGGGGDDFGGDFGGSAGGEFTMSCRSPN